MGLPLGAELAKYGHEVWGVRRTAEGAEELRAVGITPVVADVTQPETLRALPGPFDWVVNAVSSSKGGAEVYRAVYLEGTRNLIAWLASAGVRKYVYLSSTSVYGQTDGEVVTESSPTEPATETGKILVETEQLLLAAAREQAFPAVILRLAGIYGPGRGHLFQQFLKGEARIYDNGIRLMNMIHQRDVVGVTIAALERGVPGQIYNVVDDFPVSQRQFLEFFSDLLRRPMPLHASLEEEAQRKRGLTHKRVSNRRLRGDLGYILVYPDFIAGYATEIVRHAR